MTTRYSLPPPWSEAQTARYAQALAAIALVACVLALSLLAAFVPAAEPALAATPGVDTVDAPPTLCGA